MAETIHLTVQEQSNPVNMSVDPAIIIPAISPTATVTQTEDGAVLTVTDKNGTTQAEIHNGEQGEPGTPGQPGQPGQPGFSPTISVTDITGGHRVTITDATGEHSFDVMDGSDADAPVQDVQINGTSILQNGVANVPVANSSAPGVVKVGSNGITLSFSNVLTPQIAIQSDIKTGTTTSRLQIPANQHIAAFYGLAKAAGSDMASSSNPVGTYTDAAKIAIQKMLGIYEAPWELIREDTVTNETSANIEIAVDENGNAFELTDIRIVFSTPIQETVASVAQPGRVRCYYDDLTNDVLYIGAYDQASGAAGRVSCLSIEQKDGMINRSYIKGRQTNSEGSFVSTVNPPPNQNNCWIYASRTYKKIVIEGVTGKADYTVYGRRKWN